MEVVKLSQHLFIPKTARVLCILQLCFAFSVLAFYLTKPFFQEIFDHKNSLLLVNEILGVPTIANDDVMIQNKLENNKGRFEKLSIEQQRMIYHYRDQVVSQIDSTLKGKIYRLKRLFLFEIDPFEKVWILLAILIPIFLLLKFEGAVQVSWLLPVVVGFFFMNNVLCGNPPISSADLILFPSEEELMKKYTPYERSLNIQQQYIQLKEAWQFYLVDQWANQFPSMDPMTFKFQIEEGQYAFNLARLKKIIEHPLVDKQGCERVSLVLLFFYFIWNFFFAFLINRTLSTSKVYKNIVTQLQS